MKLWVPEGFVSNVMSDRSAPSSPETGRQATVPVRSPRTSIILAELARQRRLERRQRRLKRQWRRQAWAQVRAWLYALSQWPFEAIRTQEAPEVRFSGTMPLVYAQQPSSQALGSTLS